jgi:hypothetical protein
MYYLPFKHYSLSSSFILSSRNKISKAENDLASVGSRNYLDAAFPGLIRRNYLRLFVGLISILLLILSSSAASELSITAPQSIEVCRSNI